MSDRAKFIFISLLAPITTIACLAVIFGSVIEALIMSMIGYPIMIVMTCLLGALLLPIFKKISVPKLAQCFFVLLLGVIGGAVVYGGLFFEQIFQHDAFSKTLLIDYTGLGVVTAFSAWVLMNVGPFRIGTK